MKPKMSQYGATLQTFNHELVKCKVNSFTTYSWDFSNLKIAGLEELKVKRNEIADVVNKEELEKKAVEKEIRILQNQLSKINSNLQKHKTLQENYDRAILDAEVGFKKVNTS